MTATADIEAPPAAAPVGEAIRVRGLVQGVGFRPTVWRLARDCGVSGDVRNDAEGVLIRAFGDESACASFRRRLSEEAPPLARIDALETAPLVADAMPAGFAIAESAGGDIRTGVVADAASCAACLDDIRDPANRRYRYAFTNCTHCGPRLSIVNAIPYDRRNTSMHAFDLCSACRAEYENPADRRFHAQPNACPACGPRLWLESTDTTLFDAATDVIETTQHLLRAGYIVAIKGIGGVHLACDASNELAVARLRQRKHRYRKPFALMARDIAMVRRYCAVSADEAALLESVAAPIVLLEARGELSLAESVAPTQRTLGFMTPYSPLHHLLLEDLETPIVLTSGNRSDEPQCITNDEARTRLGHIADVLLLHDRDIVNRLDDSVVRVTTNRTALLRRARGYAPAPLSLPAGFDRAAPVLACGGELKNTFCLLRDGQAILSQHLGDLENAAAHAAYRETLALYLRLYEHVPACVAIDRHPEYLPGKLGREYAAQSDLPLVVTQHHHAHIAACLADNGVEIDAAPVLGVALDGLGYGDDDAVWGGEFLLADYRHAKRLARFAPLPMPGGVRAILEPWRMAYAHLKRADDWQELRDWAADLPFFRDLATRPLRTIDGMLGSGFNSPLTSSAGRLFDAVAAVIGVCLESSYEGQAAIELEAAVDDNALSAPGYPFGLEYEDELLQIEPLPMWRALLADLRDGVPRGVIAARFHTGLAAVIAAAVERLATVNGDAWRDRVALSGGVFQNAILCDALLAALQKSGFTVLMHERVPANDGGLSLGQAVIAAARAIHNADREETPCV